MKPHNPAQFNQHNVHVYRGWREHAAKLQDQVHVRRDPGSVILGFPLHPGGIHHKEEAGYPHPAEERGQHGIHLPRNQQQR